MSDSRASLGEMQGTRVDEEGRAIYFFDQIDEDTACFLVQALHFLSEEFESEEPIRLYIDSGGGSMSDAFGVYDCIRALRVPVHTYAIADVSSAATVVFLAGEKRFAYPHAQVYLHALTKLDVSGSTMHLEALTGSMRWYVEKWSELIARELRACGHGGHGEKGTELYHRDIGLGESPAEWILGGAELKRRGWVDEVVHPAARPGARTPDAGAAGAPRPDRMDPPG